MMHPKLREPLSKNVPFYLLVLASQAPLFNVTWKFVQFVQSNEVLLFWICTASHVLSLLPALFGRWIVSGRKNRKVGSVCSAIRSLIGKYRSNIEL